MAVLGLEFGVSRPICALSTTLGLCVRSALSTIIWKQRCQLKDSNHHHSFSCSLIGNKMTLVMTSLKKKICYKFVSETCKHQGAWDTQLLAQPGWSVWSYTSAQSSLFLHCLAVQAFIYVSEFEIIQIKPILIPSSQHAHSILLILV